MKTKISLGRAVSRFFEAVLKAQPTGSSVHVPVPMGGKKKKTGKPPAPGTAPAPVAPTRPDPSDGDFINPSVPIDNLETVVIKSGLGLLVDKSTDESSNDLNGALDMQRIIEGMDYELESGGAKGDEDMAHEAAIDHLNQDPDYYRKKEYARNESDDSLDLARAAIGVEKDTRQTDYQPDDGEGFNLDLGSGQARHFGYVGLDLFPYDHGTIVHDLAQGIPFPDHSVKTIQMVNSLQEMDELSHDPKPLLAEIQRVLMPGGQFHYEGPNQIYNYPEYLEEQNVDKLKVSKGGPGSAVSGNNTRLIKMPHSPYTSIGTRKGMLVNMEYREEPIPISAITHVGQHKYVTKKLNRMVKNFEAVKDKPIDVLKVGEEYHVIDGHHRYLASLKKGMQTIPARVREKAKNQIAKGNEGVKGWVKQDFRCIKPDPATANDAEPRIGVAQYDMLPADALLAMDAVGYYNADATSSGRGNRLAGYPSQGALVGKGGPGSGPSPGGGSSADRDRRRNEHAQERLKRQSENDRSRYESSKVRKSASSPKVIPIFKSNKMKQIVYGVVLSPDEADLQDDFMTADDIEQTAHAYLADYRVVGSGHTKPMAADVVESYIAPRDFDFMGQHGPQKVKKGAWVLGVKVTDPKEWQKVLNGEYNAFSVGGLGLRDAV